MLRKAVLACALFASAIPVAVWAQPAGNDVLVMRRALGPVPNGNSGGSTGGSGTGGSSSGGSSTSSGGSSSSGAGQGPFVWLADQWVRAVPGDTCSPAVRNIRDVHCVRESDRAWVDESNCAASGPRPPTEAYFEAYSYLCQRFWQIGEWSEWSSRCDEHASRTRTVKCFLTDDQHSFETEWADWRACGNELPASYEEANIQTGC